MLLDKSICLPCATGFCDECPQLKGNSCCCDDAQSGVSSTREISGRTGPIKSDEDVTDPKSTGRKRAAVLYPISEGMVCEWSYLKNAGGGIYPIVGCPGNSAVARHHGPDKNTLNNEQGNVHRICADCHNRWHSRNDPVYETHFGTDKWQTHDAESKASNEEVLQSEVYWSKAPTQRLDHEH